MAVFKMETKNKVDIKQKPRVYFTCHPADFDRYFHKLCRDIFKTHDCAVFYTEDMTAGIPEEDKATDLESNNLFIVPVTFRLLSQPNRAMDADIPFAFEKHIPVLPFMMEQGIDGLYGEKFGELQYLDPCGTDVTAISYEDKLKKYLDSVLISDELAKRIRAAFDAYIFLSYRKKDRRYANQLMRLIHSHPECRDIAIWFDEFLTPGESFKANIEKALQNSKLFTLLVTPNLLEEPDGKPNFVMGEEYPAAKRSHIDILPAQMEETDREKLAEKYQGLPSCMDPHDEAFRARLLEVVSKIAANDGDPTHNFLIGLAYLEGIDMEVDRQRGLALITSAAEAHLPEAMEKLYNIYADGVGVGLDYQVAAQWAQRLAEYYKKHCGEADPLAMLWMHNLAHSHYLLGNYQKAVALQEQVYALRRDAYGEEHPDTMLSLNNLAMYCSGLGNNEKALELLEKLYPLQCAVLGREHPGSLVTMNNLALTYIALAQYAKGMELQEQVCALRRQVLGEEHPDTLTALSNLAHLYNQMEDCEKALELQQWVYSAQCRVLGGEHPHSLTALNNLAATYMALAQYTKGAELQEQVYALRCKVLGEEHPDTLAALNSLAVAYAEAGSHQKALALNSKVYETQCRLLGQQHPDTLMSLATLALTYSYMGHWEKALELQETLYGIQCRELGAEHPNTLSTLHMLASFCLQAGDYRQMLTRNKAVYEARRQVLGEEHEATLASLGNLALAYDLLGEQQKAIGLYEKVYGQFCRLRGQDHPDTLTVLQNLATARYKTGDRSGAIALLQKGYAIQVGTAGPQDPEALEMLEFLKTIYREETVCQWCGGPFHGWFRKTCSKCGRRKDY